ncbi:arsenate reductase (thioredoxin) [Candidatus Enterococcus murrayae]|uniref:Arsenate reductase (Thioredoxin) n=1 Tax=Candidatus Enterococcus murrayae TaxID=2815321 RepID=A0ABS3HL73_9ENTE|nr:arsenate reductase (thioredoxin) [Enterococcus sp. MJM16]MBO0454195.1 arsenate reductase (thioredoxin) [Enterococcus sp. MJM16]
MSKIYFLCTGNSCRSQMAEGFAKKYFPPNWEIRSAGVETHGLNPRAVQVMRELNIDISANTSDLIDSDYFDHSDIIITLCGDAKDKCPIPPSQVRSLHWDLTDPAKATGTEEEMLAEFRKTRDTIEEKMKKLVADFIE